MYGGVHGRTKGIFELYTGPMKAGKTEALIERLGELQGSFDPFIFKPSTDTRYSQNLIRSRNGRSLVCTPFSDEDVFTILDYHFNLYGVDEIQFFGGKILRVIDQLLSDGVTIIASGLDRDFRGEPFGIMPEIEKRATKLRTLVGRCDIPGCQEPGTRSQLIYEGEPAPYDLDIAKLSGFVGLVEKGDVPYRYECRCVGHHEVPGRL